MQAYFVYLSTCTTFAQAYENIIDNDGYYIKELADWHTGF